MKRAGKRTLKKGPKDSVDAYAKRIEPQRRSVYNRMRRLIQSSDRRLVEGIAWGNPTYWLEGPKKKYLLWLYAYPRTDYVNFGFFDGTSMTDPKRRLEGTGTRMRHIKVRSSKDIDAPYFTRLAREAVRRATKGP